MTVSTRNLRELPTITGLRRLTRSLAMLDAILSPDWEYRYYSFNSTWAAGEMMASMRSGSGDYWFALFCHAGVALHGLAHEAAAFRPGKPWPGIFDRLPHEFHANFLREPAFTTEDSTFCIWRLHNDGGWACGPIEHLPDPDPDGSAALLALLAGQAEQYVEFAQDYYERQVEVEDVKVLYEHRPLTASLVGRLNAEVGLDALAADVVEIGYPEAG